MAMLENKKDLALDLLNRATHSWVEMDYNRAIYRDHLAINYRDRAHYEGLFWSLGW